MHLFFRSKFFIMKTIKLILGHGKLCGYCVLTIALLVGLQLMKPVFSEDSENQNASRNFQKINVGLPTGGMTPVVFADLDNSRSSDIVYLSKDFSQLFFYYFNKETNNFSLKYTRTFTNTKIVHVFPFDFTYNGFNDLIVAHSKDGKSPFKVSILKNKDGILADNLEYLGIETTVLPFAENSFGFNPEIIYVPPNSNFAYKINNKKEKIVTTLPKFSSLAAAEFVSGKNIYLAAKTDNRITLFDSKFTNKSSFTIPDDTGDLYVADFNNDNSLDIMFPVFPNSTSEKPFICIMFNQNKENQPFIDDETCSKKQSSMRVSLNGLTNKSIISIGDLDLNSRPDIVVSVNKKTRILINQDCRGCSAGDILFAEHPSVAGEGAIFDLFTDGNLDIVTSNGAYKGNLVTNEMFLIVSPLNGICLEHCKEGQSNPDPQPLSAVVTGATTRLTYTDKSGVKYNVAGVTRATNHIEMPYTVFGLGKRIHYIEEVNIISAIRDTWTWVLPNSIVYASKDHSARIIIGYKIRCYGIFFSFTVLLVVLGFFVVYFSTEEDEEDKKEAEKMLPLF